MNFIRFICPLVIAAAAHFFGGCASPTQSNAMVSTSMGVMTNHAESLSLNVTGGSETSVEGAPPFSIADFASALGQSIQQCGLFAKIIPAGQASDYQLEVAIVSLQQPVPGFAMTVGIETNWTLIHLRDHAVIWRQVITTIRTASTGEAYDGATRLRLAMEVAARDNIKDALTQISALTLP